LKCCVPKSFWLTVAAALPREILCAFGPKSRQPRTSPGAAFSSPKEDVAELGFVRCLVVLRPYFRAHRSEVGKHAADRSRSCLYELPSDEAKCSAPANPTLHGTDDTHAQVQCDILDRRTTCHPLRSASNWLSQTAIDRLPPRQARARTVEIMSSSLPELLRAEVNCGYQERCLPLCARRRGSRSQRCTLR
jgi:hypothetical protein